MSRLLLSALIFASVFQTALGEQSGEWIYTVENNQATITGYTGAGGAVTIPSEVNGIPVVALIGNLRSGVAIFGNSSTAVTSVTIPNTVTSIGGYAFSQCSGLTNVTIPNSVTSIGPGAFQFCASLSVVTIPNTVTSIGSYAFISCNSLTNITIPNSVTTIEEATFNGCRGLTRVTIPNSVTSIGDSAFYGCEKLHLLVIPSSVTNIGRYAFGGSGSLLPVPQDMCIVFASSVAVPSVFRESIPNNATVLYMDAFQVLADNEAFVTAMANNDAFVTAVANKIKATGGTYGIATQSGLSSAITTAVEPLATKTELTSSLTQSRTDGINSVLSNPNLWTLYTTSQIQNMAVGDLVLTKNVGGTFTLNYDIEQSTDLQNWTPYQAYALPLTGLPTDKAFVRIKAK